MKKHNTPEPYQSCDNLMTQAKHECARIPNISSKARELRFNAQEADTIDDESADIFAKFLLLDSRSRNREAATGLLDKKR
jgi:hypothetical protein